MKWPVEKDIRLFILDGLDAKDKDLAALYRHLRKEAKTVGKPIEMDVARATNSQRTERRNCASPSPFGR